MLCETVILTSGETIALQGIDDGGLLKSRNPILGVALFLFHSTKGDPNAR